MIDRRRGAREAAAATLDAEQRLRELGHRHPAVAAVENHQIGGMADLDTVIGG